ncbi:MAG: hypothetical protein ABWK01_06425 [Infirmifilum sp.]
MGGLKKLTVSKSFLVEHEDLAYAFYKLLEPVVRKSLEEYRGLKAALNAAKTLLADLVKRKNANVDRINTLARLIPDLESKGTSYALLGLLMFLFSLFLLPSDLRFLGFILLLAGGGVGLYGLNLRSQAASYREELERLRREVEKLNEEIPKAEKQVRDLTAKMNSFRLPAVSLSAFRCYVPLAVVRNPLGGQSLVVAPWSPGEQFVLTYVYPDVVEEARSQLVKGEGLYMEASLRGKDAGYKVIESFRQMNLWEKVLESRSPERVLREIIEESHRLLMQGVEEQEEVLRLEKLDEESARLLVSLTARADGAQPEPLLEDSARVVEEEVGKLRSLAEAVKQLSVLRGFLEEAREIASRRELYSSIVDLAVREMISRVAPLEPEVLAVSYRAVYCPRCAERLVGDYEPSLDLRRWVYSEILGGVDKDPDILLPDKDVKDIIAEEWGRLEERVYRELPLPGTGGDEPFEELKKKYEEALRRFSLPFTGAEEQLTFEWVSAFQPPRLRCTRCGSVVEYKEAYSLLNLQLPVVKGYAALLFEKEEELLKKSSEIVSSVNSARLHKDERKTTVGIYRQSVQNVEQEVLRLERELREVESHYKNLETMVLPLLAAPAVQDLLREVSEHDLKLHEQLGKVLAVVGGGK